MKVITWEIKNFKLNFVYKKKYLHSEEKYLSCNWLVNTDAK